MTQSEIQRRRRLIQHLHQNSVATATSRTEPSAATTATTGGQPQRQQQQQQQSQMKMALRQQDDMIDELAVGVGRLKTQTAAIGDEARMHVNLINDMDTNLDAAQGSLEDQTRRAARLPQDQSLWRLQLIVAVLFVLLVLLIFLGLTP